MSYDADKFEYGDKVEVMQLCTFDATYNIKVGDVAKVRFVQTTFSGEQYIECYNPEWDHEGIGGDRNMLAWQIKKVG